MNQDDFPPEWHPFLESAADFHNRLDPQGIAWEIAYPEWRDWLAQAEDKLAATRVCLRWHTVVMKYGRGEKVSKKQMAKLIRLGAPIPFKLNSIIASALEGEKGVFGSDGVDNQRLPYSTTEVLWHYERIKDDIQYPKQIDEANAERFMGRGYSEDMRKCHDCSKADVGRETAAKQAQEIVAGMCGVSTRQMETIIKQTHKRGRQGELGLSDVFGSPSDLTQLPRNP